jgi:hypothetical protein
MTYKNLVFAFIVCLIGMSAGAAVKYPISVIPEALLKNAGAVVREDQYDLEISSIRNSRLSRKYVVTIFKQNFVDMGRQVIGYDKFRKIRNISCVVYNAAGDKVKSLANDKILDVTAISGYSLFEDSRVKVVDPDYALFPFTVVIEWEEVYEGSLSYPSWAPYSDYQVSVQHSGLKVKLESTMKPLRYLEMYGAPACVKSSAEQMNIYEWNLNNLPAIKSEPYSGGIDDYTPAVYLAPSDFTMDSYDGNSESWENFGKWNLELQKGRDGLSPETVNKIKELVKNETSEREKIRLIYRYMQQKVRYVNLALGIGGWQPMDAARTDQVSYGDCKGLSFYMKSLLNIVEIPSLYTIVRASSNANPIFSDFPSNQFNHIILCVPVENDTIWLECTSQRIPFDYLGSFTDDRDALLVTENGGKLVLTPVYGLNDNISNTRIDAVLDTEGNISASVKANHHGLFYDNMDDVIGMDEHDRKEFLMESISLPGIELKSYSYTSVPDQPIINQQIAFDVRKYSNVINKQIILRPNILNRVTEAPETVANRKSRLQLRRDWQENDTISISIPASAKIGSLPKDVDLKSDFGEYHTKYIQVGNKLLYIRTLIRKKGNFEPARYAEFVTYMDKIRKADDLKLPVILE